MNYTIYYCYYKALAYFNNKRGLAMTKLNKVAQQYLEKFGTLSIPLMEINPDSPIVIKAMKKALEDGNPIEDWIGLMFDGDKEKQKQYLKGEIYV